jgi:hypothetical protein
VLLAALVASLSDPRWLPAACLLFCAYWAKEVVWVASGRSLLVDTLLPVLVFWVIVPTVALLIVRGVRSRALRTR